jgi:two-component system, chemotaxis family, protein-glutamate methylesterase/glutaminase
MKTKVLVVDDSAIVRTMLTQAINAARDLHVVGTAANPIEAQEAIRKLNPDVMTLDVEMPRMDGLAFLRQIMRSHPMPVIMVSNLTERGSETTLKALELGAVDFVSKPRGEANGLQVYADDLCEKIRAAHHVRRSTIRPHGRITANHPAPAPVEPTGVSLSMRSLSERLVLIGASTGGTEAIKDVLSRMPEQCPGILIVQHMPEMFTSSFAKRLDGLCRIRVKEAADGEKVQAGTAYIAPGHSHLMVKRVGGVYVCELMRGEPVNRHRPSVDVLFHSAAKHVGANGVGVMLTGMGKDGASGMLAMREAGCYNICQDQESCVVWGMPREATINGAAHETATLKDIAGKVMNRLRSMESRLT